MTYNKPMWEFIDREKKGGGFITVDWERDVERKRARDSGSVLIRDPLRMRTEPYAVMQ